MVKLAEVNNFINPRYVVTDNIEKFEFHRFVDVFEKVNVVANVINCLFTMGQFSSKLLYNKSSMSPHRKANHHYQAGIRDSFTFNQIGQKTNPNSTITLYQNLAMDSFL